ncbi:hypothetical protein MA16_Dca018949 [Dendrobium catenatum]|uniref:Uncharacterized protein n=1 Tax=Dendrobium catenatum TaxID=906689 RepID=A0A2I0WNT4_9ASPA|nr:hypothetical protein MA16_Dca018949 [Dendrobium catenatum]
MIDVFYLKSMDPEQNATDGINMEEGRELPEVAEPQRNNIMESFAQMMEAMTQMIKTSQNQASGSGGGGRPMDKNLKLFQDMKPPLFSGGGPIEAED